MDLAAFIDTRRKRHTAMTLKDCESRLERELKAAFRGDIPHGVRDALADHKATVRKRFQAFGDDFTDMIGADVQINEAAIELRDRLATA